LMHIPYTTFWHNFHYCWDTCHSGAPVFVSLHCRMMPPRRSDHESCGKCWVKWQNGESSVLLNLLFYCTHQIFINHRQSAAPRIIMHIFASSISPISLPLNRSWHVLHIPHKVGDECQPVSCFLHSRNGLQSAFHMRQASRFSSTL
jgi:hypothetical protein